MVQLKLAAEEGAPEREAPRSIKSYLQATTDIPLSKHPWYWSTQYRTILKVSGLEKLLSIYEMIPQ